jgi:hypothetical protein
MAKFSGSMIEAMQSASLRVKSADYLIEVVGDRPFIATEYCPRDEVSNLDKSRCPRISKKWNVGEVVKASEWSAHLSVGTQKGLKSSFMF